MAEREPAWSERLLVSWRRSLRARNLSPKTLSVYLSGAAELARWLTAETDVDSWAQVRRRHVEEWIGHLIDTTSASTANNRYRAVQQLFKWLADEEEIPANPMARMSPPRLEEKLVPLLSDLDAARLLKSCTGGGLVARRDLAILRLFMATGIRLAEMAGLRLDDVDLDERTAIVTGKGRRTRIVRFDPETARALDRYLRIRDGERDRRRPQLWLGEKGRGPLGPTGIYQMLVRRAERLGIEVHPHQFRHTFAHKWLAHGGAEGDLMEMMGWSSPQMIRRYGASARGERARSSYDRVDVMGRL
jgi:site-specific recombinase XerD